MTTLGKVTAATAEKLRGLHPDVPAEKWVGIVARSLIGAVLSIVGLALMGAAAVVTLRLLATGQTPSALGLSALAVVGGVGLFLFGWGLITVAGRVVKQPLAFALATLRGVASVIRGK